MVQTVADPRVRRPVKSFGEVDWDGFDYQALESIYSRSAPTVMRLIKFLTGQINASEVIGELKYQDQDTPESTPNHGNDDSEGEGPDTDVPDDTPSKRKERRRCDRNLISITVMGLLTYGRSRRANILQTTMGFYSYASRIPKRAISVFNRLGLCCSYESVISAMEYCAKGVEREARRRAGENSESLMVMYNNFDIQTEVQDQRLHNKAILQHNTIGAVIFLRRKNGKPWMSGSEGSIQEESAPGQFAGQEWIYELPTRKWVIDSQVNDFRASDIMKPLWSNIGTYWPSFARAMVNDILWKYAGDDMGKNSEFPATLQRFEHPEVFQLNNAQVDAYPLEAWDLNEATLEGSKDILDCIRVVLGLSDNWVKAERLCPISGDQLTISKIRTL